MSRRAAHATLAVPEGCINANALRSLASTLDRLKAFHTSRGGQLTDEPCLREVIVDNGTIYARVLAGDAVVFRLKLVSAAWEFV